MAFSPSVIVDREQQVAGQTLHLKVVQIGATFVARLDNIDPGAVIARGRGNTADEAIEAALVDARVSLGLLEARGRLRDLDVKKKGVRS